MNKNQKITSISILVYGLIFSITMYLKWGGENMLWSHGVPMAILKIFLLLVAGPFIACLFCFSGATIPRIIIVGFFPDKEELGKRLGFLGCLSLNPIMIIVFWLSGSFYW